MESGSDRIEKVQELKKALLALDYFFVHIDSDTPNYDSLKEKHSAIHSTIEEVPTSETVILNLQAACKRFETECQNMGVRGVENLSSILSIITNGKYEPVIKPLELEEGYDLKAAQDQLEQEYGNKYWENLRAIEAEELSQRSSEEVQEFKAEETSFDNKIVTAKNILQKLDSYFKELAKTDPKKLEERKESYLQIQQAIEEEDLHNLVKHCKQFSKTYGGLGPERYSKILKELMNFAVKEYDAQAQAKIEKKEYRSLLNAAQQLLINEKAQITTEIISFVKDKGYALFNHSLRPGFFNSSGRSEVKLFDLGELLMDIKVDKPINLPNFFQEVAKIDEEYQEKFGAKAYKGDELGKLLTGLKDIINKYDPVGYAQVKTELKNSKDLKM